MYNKFRKKSLPTLIITFLLSALMLGTVATATQKSDLVSLFNPPRILVNTSYISPLVELFGDVSVGKKVFIASNTVLQAAPETHLCIGNETNLQDNILFLALRNAPAPATECGSHSSSLGERTSIAHQATIKNSKSVVGQRTAIRADEGSPIIIGENAEIEDRVTFHALKGTSIRIGKNLNSDDNIVFHGPLEVGDNLAIEDDAVLFRSQVGNNVTIGREAIVVGVKLRDGVKVPHNAIITTQEQADALKSA